MTLEDIMINLQQILLGTINTGMERTTKGNKPNVTYKTSSSLATMKKLLKEYYLTALSQTFDPKDPRTWKTYCIKCNCVRSLLAPIHCCFCTSRKYCVTGLFNIILLSNNLMHVLLL